MTNRSRKRRVAVIGSNSFTGSHVVDALLEDGDSEVVALSRSPEKGDLYLPYRRQGGAVAFHQADLVREPGRVLEILDAARPSHVVNVAALSEVELSHEKPAEYFEVNCLAVVRLCDALRKRSYLERYVHVSTAEVYGTCEAPVAEDAPLCPSTPYAASKAAADMYLLAAARHHGFPVTLVRSTNVYGKHQQLYKIVPRTVIYLRTNRVIDLHAGGAAVKAFVHVRDVVRGVLTILDHAAPAPVYHFSSAEEVTVKQLVNRICALMGRDPATATRTTADRQGQDNRYWLDCSRAAKDLGWVPGRTIEETLREVIDWIGREWARVSREPHEYAHGYVGGR